MEGLEVFNFEGCTVRTVLMNNEPWFVGKDVATVLGYAEPRSTVSKKVDIEDRGVAKIETPSGVQDMTVVNESGVYALIFGSKLPKAKDFKRWVTSEVIPSVRKYGAYMSDDTLEKALTNPDFLIRLATELKNEKDKRLELESLNQIQTKQIEELRPKADYCDQILQTKDCMLITQIAKDYGYTPHFMNKLLHELGAQYKVGKQWVLYSKYDSEGYVESDTSYFEDRYGISHSVTNTKWTQKGRLFIYELLKENGILPLVER